MLFVAALGFLISLSLVQSFNFRYRNNGNVMLHCIIMLHIACCPARGRWFDGFVE